MIASKFKSATIIILVIIAVGFIVGPILLFSSADFGLDNYPSIFMYSMGAFFGLFYITVILGLYNEVRIKAVVLQIQDDYLVRKSFIGLGRQSTYQFNELSGFKTSVYYNFPDTVEYLYLIKGNKKVVIISEQYHLNYQELKQMLLSKNIENWVK